MQTLAIQIDQDRCRLLLIESAGKSGRRLIANTSVPKVADPSSQAAAIQEAMPALRRGAAVAIALPGDEVRSRRLRAPAAADDELLQIVTLQVEREALREALAIDFVPLSSEGDTGAEIVAAWCDRELIEHWRQVAEAVGGKLRHAVPRVICAAAAFPVPLGVVLLATAHEQEVDFLLLCDGLPVMVRSTRLSDETPAAIERELKRTLLSVSQELSAVADPDTPVTVLHAGALDAIGSAEEFWLERHAPEQLVSDAFQGAIDQGLIPECLPAIGVAKLTAEAFTPVLDLANPRGADQGEGQRAPNLLLVAATAVVLLAGAWMAYAYQASLKQKIADQQATLAETREGADRFAPYQKRASEIEDWLASDVTWLDELERLSRAIRPVALDQKEFPADEDMRVSQVLATAAVGSGEPGGVVVLQARAKSASTQQIESRLRDALHSVEPNSMAEIEATDGYEYRYTARLGVPAASDVTHVEETP